MPVDKQDGRPVSKLVGYILTSYQPDFAVMQGSKLLGIVTRDDVLRTLAGGTQDVHVSGIMQRDVVASMPTRRSTRCAR